MSCSRKWAVVILTFSRYYMPVMITLGIMGNLFCVLIFCKTKLYRLPVTRFLIALSLVDSGVLFISLWNIVGDPLAVYGLCHLLLYLNNVLCFLSVWLVVSFTLERYIAIKYPLLKIKWDTVGRSRLLIVILCLISLVWNSYILFVTTTQKLRKSKRVVCSTLNDHWFVMNVINYVDSMVTLAVPFFIIAVLNISISRTVMRRRRMCHNTVVTMLRYVTFSANLATGDRRCSVIEQNLENKKKDEKVTKTLLIISVVFLLMNLPDHVLRVLVSFLNDNGRWAIKNQYVICGLIQGQMISTLLFHTNFAINFILYSLAGDNFRTHMTGFCRQVWGKWSSIKRSRTTSDARTLTLKSGHFVYSYQSTAHSIAIGHYV